MNPEINIPAHKNSTELLHAFSETRYYSMQLCEPLEVEDFVPQSADFASPPKWHLAHTTWFFEEMILKAFVPDYKVFHEAFSYLFNSYYNAIGQRLERGQRGLITRPSVAEVMRYREYVDKHMKALLMENCSKEVSELCVLGINHEQQHQELLLTDLKYTFSLNPMYPKYCEKPLVNSHERNQSWIKVEAGLYEIGSDETCFCFDNECGRHKVYLEDFEISSTLVTNRDYIEFIESGAYSNPLMWLDEGWAWIESNKAKHPLYWHTVDGVWHHYTLAGLQVVDLDAPIAHVSFYEASAYAQFKNMRLPTEFEWEVSAPFFEWGKRWEWTNSAYLPYPNFKIKEGAVGEYNGKFMMNQMVLRGASVTTAKGHSRLTYRNFFHANAQWQFSGIRLVK